MANKDQQYVNGKCLLEQNPENAPQEMTEENGLLYYKSKLYIPALTVPMILKLEHDLRVAGNF